MIKAPAISKQKNCSTCGTAFTCGATDDSQKCWCNDYPAIFVPDTKVDCLCPDCLKAATIKKVGEYVSSITQQEAINNNKAKELPKTNRLIKELDYYMDNGRFVFTAWYHLMRGACCKSGCRHCPYGFQK